MLGLPNGAKIYFCSQPVDLRRGFDGLSGIVESVFEMNVLDGHLFLFVNRKRDRIKALWWEAGGLIQWYKRLEQGTFEMPRASADQSACDDRCHATGHVDRRRALGFCSREAEADGSCVSVGRVDDATTTGRAIRGSIGFLFPFGDFVETFGELLGI